MANYRLGHIVLLGGLVEGIKYSSLFTYYFKQAIFDLVKGPSKNVNIFMSVQTVHFFRPPPPSTPSVQTNIFGFQNMGFTQNIYCAITKINPYLKPV